MSKWETFNNKPKAEVATNQSIKPASGLFAPAHHPQPDLYRQGETSIDLADAMAKVTRQIQRNFDTCDRLPKSPIFHLEEGDVDVKDGVMGAMGTVAIELLELAQSQELSASLGLGSPAPSSDAMQQDNGND